MREFPGITYDVTIKIEHLLKHRDLLPVLARTGCLFITSAVESLDDAVLARLDKGHTQADFLECAGADARARPDAGADLRAVHAVDHAGILSRSAAHHSRSGSDWRVAPDPACDPPADSGRIEAARAGRSARRTNSIAALCLRWAHPDPEMDRLCSDLLRIVRDGGRKGFAARRFPAHLGASLWRAAGFSSGRPGDNSVI